MRAKRNASDAPEHSNFFLKEKTLALGGSGHSLLGNQGTQSSREE